MRKVMFIVIVTAVVSWGCGGQKEADNTVDLGSNRSSKNAPRFLSTGQDVDRVTPQGSVTFSALVTDPNGIEDIVGGEIRDVQTGRTIASLSTAADEGSYQAVLTWTTIRKVWDQNLEPEESASRQFAIEIQDRAGHTASRNVSATLYCNASKPCDGRYGNCEDKDGDGYGLGPDCEASDCDDTDKDVHPGAEDVCYNDIDDNCDGHVNKDCG
jgi:hypothetical protein